MIELCYQERSSEVPSPVSVVSFVGQAAALGVAFQRVERPTGTRVCLQFTSLEDAVFATLPIGARGLLVIVAEGGRPAPENAESEREELGLLGLVEPRAFISWRGGLFVTWGFHGRADVAVVAELVRTRQGLESPNKFDALPEIIGRFLRAAVQTLAQNHEANG